MGLFEHDASKPGRRMLAIGAISYALAWAACVIWAASGAAADKAMLMLFMFPIGSPLLALSLGWMALWVGIVTGVPYVSFAYTLSAAKRNFRGIIGWILLISVALAALIALRST